MLNPFQEVRKSEARAFTSLPARYRKKKRTAWSDPNRQGASVDSFLSEIESLPSPRGSRAAAGGGA